jgi:hypothetical protein
VRKIGPRSGVVEAAKAWPGFILNNDEKASAFRLALFDLMTNHLTMKNAFFFLLLLAGKALFAQDKIDTDRPTETQSAKTVGRGTFQLETGFRKDWQVAGDYSLRVPDAEWRYGVLDRLELRLYTLAETDRMPRQGKRADGLRPVEVGLKGTVWQSRDTSFIATLYGHLGVKNWAAKEHRPDQNFYRLRILLHNQLTETVGLSYNLGRDWHADREKHLWVYTVSPHMDLGEKWQLFAEGYGYFNRGEQAEHYVDAGAAYFIGRNVEIDMAGGKGLSGTGSEYFFTVGVSWRVR